MHSLGQKTKGEVCGKSKGGGCTRIRQHARAVAKNNGFLNAPCAKCGYTYHTQICHIKPIKLFTDSSLVVEINDMTNLVQLCPNCHWELDHPNS
jgi:5-methylcytosine-specific restriction endonuclease McrA